MQALNSIPIQAKIEAERRRRVLAKDVQPSMDDFYWFCRHMFFKQRGYEWQQAKHHQMISDSLMRVYRGECKRLIINIPPRYSKTQMAVIGFMAWTMGHHPDSEFIHTSYSGRLATGNSWQTREMITHDAYRKIFPSVALHMDSKAKDEWRTSSGGCVYAVGAGGTITGYGAGKHRAGFGGAIIIDDPHKADEVRSDTMRQNVIDWFQNTLESRRNSPDTPIILVMQRLHEKDLAGWLLSGGNGEEWEHCCLEAIQPDGTALWPEKHTIEVLRQMERASPMVFAGQYQQRPAPPDGVLFKPDQIKIIEAIPADVVRFTRAWDFGATEGGGDPTAGAKVGKMPDGRTIIAGLEHFQGGPDRVQSALKNTADADGHACRVRIPQDPGQAGKAQAASFSRLLAGFKVIALPVTGDKITRAEPFAAQVNVGNVVMVKASWNEKLINELRMFPNGAHDDIVDALSDGFNDIHGKSAGYFGA